ncbi:MAG TPA: tetratricopeptide repeat protein [Nitrospirae bacterium]|nr:tetratricopeptide repeat protein [Nitrospirota bacterium]
MALDGKEKGTLIKKYAKLRFTVIEENRSERVTLKNFLRNEGFTDVVDHETYEETWEKLQLSTTHILIFSVNNEEGADFLRDLIESTRFKKTPMVIFTKKIKEYPKIFEQENIIASWQEAPINNLKLELAYIKIMQDGVAERSQITDESTSLDNFTKAVDEMREDNYKEAKELLRLSLKENPKFTEAYLKMTETLIALNDYQAAQRVIDSAEKLAPNDSRVMLLKAKIAVNTMEKQDAVKLCDGAVSAHGKDMMFITEIGNIALEKGWHEEAIRYYEMVRSIDPNVIHTYNRLGIAYSRSSNFDGALAMYELALKIDELDPGIHFNMGMMYYRKNDKKTALEEFRKSSELAPEMVESQEWIEKIEAES